MLTLSRALCDDVPCEDFDSDETEAAVHAILKSLPASEPRIKDFQVATETDSQLQQLRAVIEEGWPNNITNVSKQFHEFWKVKEDLYVANNLILMGDSLVIPSSKLDLVTKVVHEGHFGIDKCKARAKSCVYWPGINDAIEAYVKKCSVCNTYAKANQKETLLPHPVPMCPWHTVGADYFTFSGQDYLLIVDYFSKYPEVIPVQCKTAEQTIQVFKSVFAHHGIPNTVIADNMPFASKSVKQFSKEWHFNIVTSSPHYPQ